MCTRDVAYLGIFTRRIYEESNEKIKFSNDSWSIDTANRDLLILYVIEELVNRIVRRILRKKN